MMIFARHDARPKGTAMENVFLGPVSNGKSASRHQSYSVIETQRTKTGTIALDI
jgi:hypothetical protein